MTANQTSEPVRRRAAGASPRFGDRCPPDPASTRADHHLARRGDGRPHLDPGRAAVEKLLHAVLLRQAGVISRAQAVACGLSPDGVDRRLAGRRWHPVHPRVYRDGGFADTPEARARATVLWAGQGAVLSGSAAAWWHGLSPEPPGVLGVTVPRHRCPRPRPGVTVRRRELGAADVRVVGGLVVVAAPLAALEAAVERGTRGPAFLEELIESGAVGLDAMRRTLERNPAAHGSASAARVVGIAAGGVLLRARRRLVALLLGSGPPGLVREHQVAGLRLGVAFPRSKVAVEVSFSSPLPDEERAWRSAVLRRHGWRVVRIEPSDTRGRAAEVLDRIRGAVDPEPTGPAGAAAS